jgi:hypothetical protein
MKRSTLLVLLAVLAIVGALVVLDVIPLGLGGDDGAAGSGGADLLGADDPAGEGATLKARGTKKADGTEKGSADTEIDLFAAVPAEVRGTTKNGGSVRGRVVRKKGGVPLAGVRVTLGRYDSLITYLRAEANGRYDELEARTGPDGRFAFLDVMPSKGYVVRARHPDYAIASSDDDLDLTGRDALDIGDVALGTGGTLTGRVVDQSGQPLPKVRVVATWRISNPIGIILSDPALAPELEREATTGADGRYTLDRLDPQPKTLFAIAPNGASQVVRSVSLEDGEMKGVDDIRMPGDGVLAGTVLWADGTPIVGARVFAAPQMQAAVRTVNTDAQGAFRLAWLPEGLNYVVGVLVKGLPVNLTMGLAIGDENVRIEFPMPGSIRGVVVGAEGGAPVKRFALRLDGMTPNPDFQMRFIEDQVKRGLGPQPFTSDTGAFEFSRVAAGTYKITATAPGYPAATVEGVVVVAGEPVEARIELARGHIASGVVRTAAGEPFAGARVFVVHDVSSGAEGLALTSYSHNRTPDAVSQADGSFELPPQTPGTYELIAAHPKVLAGICRAVDLASGDAQDLEIRLPPSGSARGLLLDESARPAKQEKVYVLYRNGVVRTARTGPDGRFEIAGLPIGRCIVRWLSPLDTQAYQLFFNNGGSVDQRETAYDELRQSHGEHDLRAGTVIEATLRIPSRTKVSGHYRIAGSVPPKGRRSFYVTVEGGGNWDRVEVTDEGAFETLLFPGTYRIYGPSASGGWEAQAIEIPASATHTLEIDN